MALVLFRVFAEHPGVFARNLGLSADHCAMAFRSDNLLSDLRIRPLDLAAHAGHANAVFVFELDGEVVIDIAAAVCVILSSPHSISSHGMSLHDPVTKIKVVDVLLNDVVAAEPVHVEPVVEMVLGKGHAGYTLSIPNVARVEVGV